jgi:hypothetical protein
MGYRPSPIWGRCWDASGGCQSSDLITYFDCLYPNWKINPLSLFYILTPKSILVRKFSQKVLKFFLGVENSCDIKCFRENKSLHFNLETSQNCNKNRQEQKRKIINRFWERKIIHTFIIYIPNKMLSNKMRSWNRKSMTNKFYPLERFRIIKKSSNVIYTREWCKTCSIRDRTEEEQKVHHPDEKCDEGRTKVNEPACWLHSFTHIGKI